MSRITIKQFVASLLCIVFVCLLVPVSASGVVKSGSCGDNLTWEISSDHILTIRGSGNMYDYDINSPPWKSEYYTSIVFSGDISKIGNYAFASSPLVGEISISPSVRNIGNEAFYDSEGITAITIPDGVVTLGEKAFASCTQLKSVTIAGSIRDCGSGLFQKCSSLESAVYSEGTTVLGYRTFDGCSKLKTVTIPSSVISLGKQDSPFTNANKLQDIYYGGTEENWNRIALRLLSECRTNPSIHFMSNTSEEDNYSVVPFKSSNTSANEYSGDFSTPSSSYLYSEGNALIRVEHCDARLIVEHYNSEFKITALKQIDLDQGFPLWGAVFPAKQFNYVILGSENIEEKQNKAIIRVIQYDKNWNRLSYGDLYDSNVSTPFEAGNIRFSEIGDYIYVHTSRLMYKSSDGVRHQSSFTFGFSQHDLKSVQALNINYVGHSFNQYILADSDNNLLLWDHGDGYPRAAVLRKLEGNSFSFKEAGRISMQDIPGLAGYNLTGLFLGGIAETTSGYISTYTYDGEGGNRPPYYLSHIYDVYICYTPKNNFTKQGSNIVKIDNIGGTINGVPFVVPDGLNGGYILWASGVAGAGSTLNHISYCHYSSTGELSAVTTIYGSLSDCQPIFFNGNVIWYTTDNSRPVFYVLNQNGVKRYPYEIGDVFENSWYYNDVHSVFNNCLMDLKDNSLFFPNENATRGCVIESLFRLSGIPEILYVPSNGSMFGPAAFWGNQTGLMNGYGNGELGEEDPITREQLAALLYRYASMIKKSNPSINIETRADFTGYSDYTKVSNWATDSMSWAISVGLINGTDQNELLPQGMTTRAQLAAILNRFVNNVLP